MRGSPPAPLTGAASRAASAAIAATAPRARQPPAQLVSSRTASMVPAPSTVALHCGGSDERCLGKLEDAGPARLGSGRRLAPQDLGLGPFAAEARPAPRALELAAATGLEPRLGAADDERHPDRDQLDLPVGVAVPVAPLVLRGEPLRELARVGLGRAVDGELECLAAVAELVDRLGLRLLEARRDRLAQRRHLGGQRLGAEVGAAQHHGARSVAAALRGREAERREHPARPRAEDPGHLELLGERGGVHRAGAPERHQREPARVDAALDRDHAQRPRHLAVGDADDALGGLGLAEPELLAEARDRGAGGIAVELDVAGEPRVRREVAEDEVRVGHRRLGAAPAVTGGPGLGARRARPHAHGAALVAPGDRAAAGADGVDVHHRQLQDAPAELARVGPANGAALDHADVARGAAHVEPDRVPVAGFGGEHPRADRAPGRAGEDAPRPRARRLRRRRDAARGAHHDRLGKAELGGGLGEPAEVAAEEGREVGVDHGRRAALVLAELGEHLVRGRDVEVSELGSGGARRARPRARARGRRRAGRSPPTRRPRRGPPRRAPRSRPRRARRSRHRARSARGRRSAGPRTRAARASARRAGRGWAGPGGRSRAGR